MVLSYDETSNGLEHKRLLVQSVLMEIVAYHYITKPTVRELVREAGSDWNVSFGTLFSAPVLEDGTLCWSRMDRTHPTTRLLGYLEKALYPDDMFFDSRVDGEIQSSS